MDVAYLTTKEVVHQVVHLLERIRYARFVSCLSRKDDQIYVGKLKQITGGVYDFKRII